ncbi:glycoside hydrolase family 76 protein [Nocardia sp. NPDC088792]|uniref:glycoside hydrolase family 76 protein n=1 Tax=Nocardia sp. NPDC088792 TaxID=3364332 RepID=UPI003800ECEF
MTSRTGRNIEPTAALWAERADLAESAIVTRHLRLLWGIPRTQLGVVGWPPTKRDRAFASWHYWWQAHLVDCCVDAANRAPTPVRRRRIAAIARTMRIRNLSGWTNQYYDDMAWLAIALERAERTQGIAEVRGGLLALDKDLCAGFEPEFGAVPWRKGSDFFNAPANGPVGIAMARLGRYPRAVEIADWLDNTLRDKETGLIFDGIHLPSGEVERPTYSYCQGVVLGLETELAVHTGEPRHAERAARLVFAVEEHMTEGGIVSGGGGGDGGLFNGILVRYLALLAVMLPGDDGDFAAARRTAAGIVHRSANAAWENRLEVEGDPLFGPDWRKPARLPGIAGAGRATGSGSVRASRSPERDLSVQLSGWKLMEAAHTVTAAGL